MINHHHQSLSGLGNPLLLLAEELPAHAAIDQVTTMQRVVAEGGLGLKAGEGGRTRLDRLYQSGAGKLRLPNVEGDAVEAVLINTAGGLTGGDQVTWSINMGEHTQAVVTTQACEKVYKSTGNSASVKTNIELKDGADLAWLPQETILFERARLQRNLEVDLAHDATFMALEPVMLGREAMGEDIGDVVFRDSWRIRRSGKLLHAEEMNLSGDITQIRNAGAGLHANRAFASFLYCSDLDPEALQRLAGEWSAELPEICAGLSVLPGRIIGRFVAADSYELRKLVLPFLSRARGGASLPKVWNI